MAKRPTRLLNVPARHKGPIRKDPCAAVRIQCQADKAEIKKAAAIVAQVLSHFGAGYGAEWQKSGGGGSFPQMFDAPVTLAMFHDLLLTSTISNLPTLNWDTDQPGRDSVCSAAFAHGALAYQTSPAAPLTFPVILATLRIIQDQMCPVGAGGGKVCNF
jgi:hypothetical protein